MLERKVYSDFIEWKNSNDKKALLVTGARQIGKTFAIEQFAKKNYDTVLKINFITTPSASEIFAGDLDVDGIITGLTAFSKIPLVKNKTLIFFDEIQECPRARTAIKFLVEDGRFDYIESGSLLGVNYKEVPSYPVGYEEVIQMYPLDFEEFLWANNIQKETIEYLQKCFAERKVVNEAVHQTIMKLFKYFIIVGGMPDVVQNFVNTHDVALALQIQKNILALYRQDISKYAINDKEKIKDIFDRIPSELNTKNKRFMLSDINPSARMNRYESSFMWLNDSGVALPCYNIREPKIPLKINELRNLMKVYMNDTGLLCSSVVDNVQYEILKGNLSVNMGSILENTMAQLLFANKFNLRYFDRKDLGEVDFVLERGNTITLLEIKSGKNYKAHSALDKIFVNKEWKIKDAIVLCSGNVELQGDVAYLPWYMVQFVKPVSLPARLIVE